MYKIPLNDKGELSTCIVRYQNGHLSEEKNNHWIQLNDTTNEQMIEYFMNF